MSGNPTPPGGDNSGDKTFTQADVDRILGQRLTEERAKFANHDQLKAKAESVPGLEASVTKAQDEATAATIRSAGILALVTKGVPADRIEAALKLADLTGVKLEGGKVTGVDEAIAATLTAHPFLLPSAPPAGTPPPATPPPAAPPAAPPATGNPGSGPALTLEQINQMSQEEINKRWVEVQAVLKKK